LLVFLALYLLIIEFTSIFPTCPNNQALEQIHKSIPDSGRPQKWDNRIASGMTNSGMTAI